MTRTPAGFMPDPHLDPVQRRARGREEIRSTAAGWIVATLMTVGWSMTVPMNDLGIGWVMIVVLWGLASIIWIRVVEGRWVQPIGDRVGTGVARAATIAFIVGLGVANLVTPLLYPTLWPLELDPFGNVVRAIELPPNFGVHVVLASATGVFALVLVQGIWESRPSSRLPVVDDPIPVVDPEIPAVRWPR
jgi:hypothetical protein